MITDAGGSTGSEMARKIMACRPSKVILFELNEFALYHLDQEFRDIGIVNQGVEVVPVLGSVVDASTVIDTIRTHKVEIVLHAAAYKHVPLVEQNRLVGLQNSVIGTRVVADAARNSEHVTHFILVSTDKSVNPSNVMGASKRLAELLVQDLATRFLDTKFGAVQFGNVLGSGGSVVPLFEEQIARGGPVTVTHHEVSRFFVKTAEAARLVLMSGSFMGRGMCICWIWVIRFRSTGWLSR